MELEPRIIKTDEQYRCYLEEVEKLATEDPDPESKEGMRLELLAKLVEEYEQSEYAFAKPDPIDAILFRMEQQGLRQKDIAEFLGGKNRASEVLARKRPLTLSMIRALHEKLKIPPAILIREPDASYVPSFRNEIDESDVPIDLVRRRGWIDAAATASDMIKRFLAPAGSPVLLKHTIVFGADARTNRTRIQLWLSRVREIADSRSYLSGRFERSHLNAQLLQYVARLSWMDQGPRLAMEFLAERGIALVLEPHLPPTRLDGAALVGRNGAPVIGLTVREDRLDNFWFTLLHELVHAWKHLDAVTHRAIADERLEKRDRDSAAIEREANELAAEMFVTRADWRRSKAHLNPTPETIHECAAKYQVNPAVIAGRVRYERGNYSLFSKLVGYRQVRALFPEVRWK